MCVCVCVCVCVKRGSFRSGLQSEGSKYSVWFGSGGWGGSIGLGWWFSVLSSKNKNIFFIPLLYHCLIGQSFILLPCKQIQFFLQILLSEVVAPLTPVSNTPVCVSVPCTLVISLILYLMYPYIPGLLFLPFVVCRILASLSIVTGVAVSFNEVKPDSGIEWKGKYYTSRTVPKSNLKIVEANSIPLAHIYMTTRLPCLT